MGTMNVGNVIVGMELDRAQFAGQLRALADEMDPPKADTAGGGDQLVQQLQAELVKATADATRWEEAARHDAAESAARSQRVTELEAELVQRGDAIAKRDRAATVDAILAKESREAIAALESERDAANENAAHYARATAELRDQVDELKADVALARESAARWERDANFSASRARRTAYQIDVNYKLAEDYHRKLLESQQTVAELRTQLEQTAGERDEARKAAESSPGAAQIDRSIRQRDEARRYADRLHDGMLRMESVMSVAARNLTAAAESGRRRRERAADDDKAATDGAAAHNFTPDPNND